MAAVPPREMNKESRVLGGKWASLDYRTENPGRQTPSFHDFLSFVYLGGRYLSASRPEKSYDLLSTAHGGLHRHGLLPLDFPFHNHGIAKGQLQGLNSGAQP